jgi:hypothetical protein
MNSASTTLEQPQSARNPIPSALLLPRFVVVSGRPRFRPSVQSWSAAFALIDTDALPFRDRQTFWILLSRPPNFARM